MSKNISTLRRLLGAAFFEKTGAKSSQIVGEESTKIVSKQAGVKVPLEVPTVSSATQSEQIISKQGASALRTYSLTAPLKPVGQNLSAKQAVQEKYSEELIRTVEKWSTTPGSSQRQAVTTTAKTVVKPTVPKEANTATSSDGVALNIFGEPISPTKRFSGKRVISNTTRSAEFAEQMSKRTVPGNWDILTTELFRIPGDLASIDKMVESAVKTGKKLNIAQIGLGSNGAEPLTYLAQIQLSAKRLGKSMDDVLEKVHYIDLQKASDIRYSNEMLDKIEKIGSKYFLHFNGKFNPTDKEVVLSKFRSALKESDSKYLGKSFEDFIDVAANHGQYDMTFCNNVFYYVGKGEGAKYCYDANVGNPRYNEVVKNLLSTLGANGQLFFTHNALGCKYPAQIERIINNNNLGFRMVRSNNQTVFERTSV